MERRYESTVSYKCLFEMLIFVFVRRYPFLFPVKHAFHTNLLAISSSNMCYFLLQKIVKRFFLFFFYICFLSSSKRLYTHSLFEKSIIALLSIPHSLTTFSFFHSFLYSLSLFTVIQRHDNPATVLKALDLHCCRLSLFIIFGLIAKRKLLL